MKHLRDIVPLNELDVDTLISYRAKVQNRRQPPHHRYTDFDSPQESREKRKAGYQLAGAKLHGPHVTGYPKDVIRGKTKGERTGEKTQGQKSWDDWQQKASKPKQVTSTSKGDKVRALRDRGATQGERDAATAAMKRMGIKEAILRRLSAILSEAKVGDIIGHYVKHLSGSTHSSEEFNHHYNHMKSNSEVTDHHVKRIAKQLWGRPVKDRNQGYEHIENYRNREALMHSSLKALDQNPV